MIKNDQPTHFPSDVLVRVSSKLDGTLLDRTINTHDTSIVERRRAFCAKSDVDYAAVVYQTIVYGDEQTYDTLRVVGRQDTSKFTEGVRADALFTKELGVGLFLPVADCAATAVYDPVQRSLATLHLGRHSTFTGLIAKVLKHFVSEGSDPKNLLVWMCPHAQRASYRLEWFDHENDPLWQGFFDKRTGGYYLDMAGYNTQRFIEAGVPTLNIVASPVDTMQDDAYFSHLQGDVTGRIALLAIMR